MLNSAVVVVMCHASIIVLFKSSFTFYRNINFLSTVLFTLALSYAIIVFHCLIVVSVSLYSLIKQITPKIRVLCFVLITSVLLNLLYAWSLV